MAFNTSSAARAAVCVLVTVGAWVPAIIAADGAAQPKAAATRPAAEPMTAVQTRAFMKRLAQFVIDNHMKKSRSEQKGMTYEYFDVARKGQYDQFVQGEALDTMHDGAWFAVALATAARATGGDEFYKQTLDHWTLPFYCKMLNYSDVLFSTQQKFARADRLNEWGPNDEWYLRDGEKGFVPYWWDNGGSVSLERVTKKNAEPDFPCYDHFLATKQENPKFLLHGYSLGSSNHLAQDLGLMVQVNWCLFKDDADARGEKWTAELADAATNLAQCRANHKHPAIPAVVAPAALVSRDAKAMARVADPDSPKWWDVDNHYVRALYSFKPGQKYAAPGFADDQEYYYYSSIARTGGKMPKSLAFRLIYDACTLPMLYRHYCDDEAPPPGINVFDLHKYPMSDGRFEDYRSDRKGPFKKPRPVGSRLGPQNMVVCGLALQALKQYPGLWEERYKTQYARDLRVPIVQDFAESADGKSSVPRAQLRIGKSVIVVASTFGAMHLGGKVQGEGFTCTVYARPDAQGTSAQVKIDKDGKVTVTNHAGKPVKVLEEGMARVKDGVTEFVVGLPYTVSKGQETWANAIEHGRLSLRLAGNEVVNLYLASSEAEVKAMLERELGLGLRTWEAVFDKVGYIPTGMGEPRWERLSDTGGYAHLLSAAAQWLNYLQGQKDWELHRIPEVK